MKTINILGSTGVIGQKALQIIDKEFKKYKINYLLANNNYKLLAKQANYFKPKYLGIINSKNYFKLKKLIKNKKIKIVSGNECYEILQKKVDNTILSISGISALRFIKVIIINSKSIGFVNKESLVSAGKFIINLSKKYNTLIVPLDSEHYSIYNYFINSIENAKTVKRVFITASGGPFLKINLNKLKSISLKESLKHPTWKMGLKNTIDSSTMVNKCLEIIEAHYLFDLPYSKLEIIIHPESIVHSIITNNDGSISSNISNNDMSIPIFGFLNKNNFYNKYCDVDLTKVKTLNFIKPDEKRFKVLKIFNQINKTSFSEIIIFNTSNEIAVNLFIQNKIKFTDITKFIHNSLNKFKNYNISNINGVIDLQNYVYDELLNNYNKYLIK